MQKLKLLDLFSGIGGFSLGLERSGLCETVAFCEIEEYPRRVLAKHWPKVPVYHDVRELTAETLARDGITVDAICGGFPCQDVSAAAYAHGRTGIKGQRSGLFFEVIRLVNDLAPKAVVLENVSGLLTDGLVAVLQGFSQIGYDVEWHCIPAAFCGSPQARDRVWIIAYPAKERNQRQKPIIDFSQTGQGWQGRKTYLQNVSEDPFQPGDCWPVPLVCRVDGWPANWVDRIGSLGNTLDWRVAYFVGEQIKREIEECQ